MFYLGTNHKGAHNLLIEALATELTDFEVGFFECLCAQGSWEIAYELARRTRVSADIRPNPSMNLPLLCGLLCHRLLAGERSHQDVPKEIIRQGIS